MYISLHAPWGSGLLAISFLLLFPLHYCHLLPRPPTDFRNGSLSISRHLPNPSKALPQVLDYRSIRPAWAKGFAARMFPPSVTHPTLPTVRGGVGVC